MIKEFKDVIPHLNIEVLENGCIRLENESMGDSYVVDIHPVHLRHIAEKMGLMDSSDPTAAKTITTLQRRMVALRDRIENLEDWMARFSDHKHADLSYKTNQLNALADLAREWCYDFDSEESEQEGQRVSLSTVDSDKPTECSPSPAAQVALL